MIEKKGGNDQMQQFNLLTSASQFSNRGTNENKRATMFFNLRENTAGGLESLLESQSAAMSVIVESSATMEGASSLVHQGSAAQKHQQI